MINNYIFVTVSLINDLEAVSYSIYKLNKFYNISKYVVIVPKIDVKPFRSKLCYFKNIEILSEDEVCDKSQFLNLCNYFLKNKDNYISFRKSWYYQQILKLSYVLDEKHFSDNNLVIWDADTIPIKKIKLFDKFNQPYIYGSGYEYHNPYFFTIKNLLGPNSSLLNLSCITQFVALNLKIRKDLRKHLLDFNSKYGIENNHFFVANALLKSLSIPINSSSIIESKFSEYEFIGNFILNKYKRSKKEQKRIKFFRNYVDGNLNIIQKSILYFLDYKHLTYEKKYIYGENQSYLRFWICILRDLSIYKYFINIKKIIFSRIDI